MLKFLIALIFVLILELNADYLLADSREDYSSDLISWEKNIDVAIEYLRDAEKLLKDGDRINGCAKQKEASIYGVTATKSLITALTKNGSTDDFSDLEAGLKKWNELGDFCGKIKMKGIEYSISH